MLQFANVFDTTMFDKLINDHRFNVILMFLQMFVFFYEQQDVAIK